MPSAPIVVAEVATAASVPTEFTARWQTGPGLRAPSVSDVDGVIQMRDGAWRPDIPNAAVEPRMRGTLTVTMSADDYPGVGGPTLVSYAFRIENEDGAWQQSSTPNITFLDGSVSTSVGVLVGEGGFEGQHELVEVASDARTGIWDLRGYIVDGDLPPAPASCADA